MVFTLEQIEFFHTQVDKKMKASFFGKNKKEKSYRSFIHDFVEMR